MPPLCKYIIQVRQKMGGWPTAKVRESPFQYLSINIHTTSPYKASQVTLPEFVNLFILSHLWGIWLLKSVQLISNQKLYFFINYIATSSQPGCMITEFEYLLCDSIHNCYTLYYKARKSSKLPCVLFWCAHFENSKSWTSVFVVSFIKNGKKWPKSHYDLTFVLLQQVTFLSLLTIIGYEFWCTVHVHEVTFLSEPYTDGFSLVWVLNVLFEIYSCFQNISDSTRTWISL